MIRHLRKIKVNIVTSSDTNTTDNSMGNYSFNQYLKQVKTISQIYASVTSIAYDFYS